MPGRFVGSVALVTGGSKGIGRAVALRLASEGAAVGFTWFRDQASSETTLAALRECGARACPVKAYLGDEAVPRQVMEEIRQTLGEPRLLVSNAATGVHRPLLGIGKKEWDWTMETNAAALLRLVQAAPTLQSVVALTSLGAVRAQRGYGMVGISKAALEATVRYLALELAPGCRVNAIAAGIVETESFRRQFPNPEEIAAEALGRTPAGRLATPKDVAALAAFLLSDEAAMVTGQTIVVDGGHSILV